MSTSTTTPFADAHAVWHAEVERARTAPFGPLSATALHWLSRDPAALPGIPGRWSVTADGLVTVELDAADGVTRDGSPVAGTVQLGPLTGTAGTALAWGDVQLEVAARSGGVIVRPRDPASPDRTSYTGTATFPPRREWVITARFEPADRTGVEVASAAGNDRTQHYDSPGRAVFQVAGTEVALTLFGSVEGGDLRAIFADETGTDLTFPAARFVDVTPLDASTVRIDFTRTTNPPCAYSASATCPFPPPENRLPVRIEAGELRPGVPRPNEDRTA
ncbi:DUF1684 domain-containing protein [Leucobacter chromiireducens]|uniref:DUF1684 domain-containing protein n=1 Tax=Leucobacter chromiireducens subsp. solipictus TaxID=398235 RepID=A0ABS1SI02_9MICO|nr:DUF1684 domain-containing protein [Leucobacter chromiireducens]MBL3680186.1 DUF1684 domain-containing protein [Leucobacter chromiireducens subsp. solipictus]